MDTEIIKKNILRDRHKALLDRLIKDTKNKEIRWKREGDAFILVNEMARSTVVLSKTQKNGADCFILELRGESTTVQIFIDHLNPSYEYMADCYRVVCKS